MTDHIEKTVFISYRHTNYWAAQAVCQNLTIRGYDIFLDYNNIPSGYFAQVIEENIKSRAHFLVILSPSAIERCHEPGDWLRREIETAMDNKRNVIPLMIEGFDFKSPSTVKALTGKLSNLKNYNAISIPAEYFNAAMEKLRSDRFLNRPLEVIYHPISDTTRNFTADQKSATKNILPVTITQLTSMEWFERGKNFTYDERLDEAIHAFDKAIELDPDLTYAWENKAQLLVKLGRKKEASEIINRLINLYEEKIDIERARYDTYKDQWASGAPSIYSSSMQEVLGYYDMENLGAHKVSTRFIEELEEKIKKLKIFLDSRESQK
jgi:tetratricopeptide (TPR) repeat protein